MTALTIAGKTYPDLQIPDNYKIVVKTVPRNDEQVHLVALPACRSTRRSIK